MRMKRGKRDADMEMMLVTANKEKKSTMDTTHPVASIDISVSTTHQTNPGKRNQSKNEHKNSNNPSKRRSSLENGSGERREASGESENRRKHKKVIENKDNNVKDTERMIAIPTKK